jgi:hypothetical protein
VNCLCDLARLAIFLEVSFLSFEVIVHLTPSYFADKNYFLKVKCTVDRVSVLTLLLRRTLCTGPGTNVEITGMARN